MSDRLPAGPYGTYELGSDIEIPFYVIPFDKRGIVQAPETRDHLVAALRSGGFTDIFVFSHGWNNDWTDAIKRYEDFIAGYRELRTSLAAAPPPGYRPILIGIFWPSTALVFGEDEKGPGMAGAAPAESPIARGRLEVEELAADLSPGDAELLYRLAQKDRLSEQEARQLAGIAMSLSEPDDGEAGPEEPMDVEGQLEAWAAAADEDDELADLVAGGRRTGRQTASSSGLLSQLDPRRILRLMTVRRMKDRAGIVGGRGVAPLLRDLLTVSSGKVHLIGHSYGCKVLLTAIAAIQPLPRPVHSALLLQPAISHLSFAEAVRGSQPLRPGGYRSVLDKIEQPIFSTYSSHDFALTKMFHLALRRQGDLGEKLAARRGDPPSKYAALGGYGPRDADERLIDLLDAGMAYAFEPGVRIYGLDGSRTISGHGDVSRPETWWALHTLATRPPAAG